MLPTRLRPFESYRFLLCLALRCGAAHIEGPMQIVYCHTCGLRIPERDMAQVVRVEENIVFCPKCAATAEAAAPAAKKKTPGSKIIPVHDVPRRPSTPSIPAVAVHEPRRASAATHTPAK